MCHCPAAWVKCSGCALPSAPGGSATPSQAASTSKLPPCATSSTGALFTARGDTGPVQVHRRGADQCAEVALTQTRVDSPRQSELPGHGVGRLAGAHHVAADDAADRFLHQAVGSGGGLLLAHGVQRLIAVLKNTCGIACCLTRAIEAGGSTLRDFTNAVGKPGYFQQSYTVYGRAGAPCAVCGSVIIGVRLGQRMSSYCPVCQE